MKNKVKIAILLGGTSSEREVSLNTGNEIFKALKQAGYSVIKYDPKTDLEKFSVDFKNDKFDLCIPALHGKDGEDGSIQGYLELFNIPYCFSNVEASAVAMNKNLSKTLVKEQGIKVIDSSLITKIEDINDLNIDYPLIAKPNQGGSSVNINICNNYEELEKAVNIILNNREEVLVEKYLSGLRELTVSVIENNNKVLSLPVMEIIANKEVFYDYDSKYSQGGSTHICPAKIDKEIYSLAQKWSELVFKTIGAKDLARIDFLYDDKSNKLYFLEINTIPGMTKTSLMPEAAKKQGYQFIDLLELIISNHIK
ncbi:D-alanine--D-alanine ligase [Patescibacteria group bacterium]|nr:D-alanine--D-alanine ligase [Patescibacteria group bacterium]